MPYRTTPLVNGETYHIVSRGVAQAPIFKEQRDYLRMLNIVEFYRFRSSLRFSFYNRLPEEEKQKFLKNLKSKSQPLVEIFAFCLMPNHLHFLLKQLQERGISLFMKNFQDSYARYLNTKHHRIGSLFQSMFKAKRIETDEQLLHVSRYIHLNPATSYLIDIKNLDKYFYSSFPTYMGKRPLEFIDSSFVLDFFKSKRSYRQFVFDQADYQRKLNRIKHLLVEST